MPIAWILCGVLLLIVIVLWIRLHFLRKSMDEIRTELAGRIEQDTNTLITISSHDKYARRLASDINTQLRLLRKDQLRYLNGDRELKEAITNISHDLRTPLTAICGYLDLLEREEQPAPAGRYLGMIKNRVEDMMRLTEELFRYSIIVSEQEHPKEAVILNMILEECILSFYRSLSERNIKPDISIPEPKIIRVLDPISLRRIFDNALTNIIKYSEGDLQISMLEDGTITFINSTGKLNSVMVGRLFDRFFTLETGKKSTGLGLSIAKLLTERMKGTITAEYAGGKLILTLRFPDERCE
jgi:signal transduction histidine kinase